MNFILSPFLEFFVSVVLCKFAPQANAPLLFHAAGRLMDTRPISALANLLFTLVVVFSRCLEELLSFNLVVETRDLKRPLRANYFRRNER